MERVKTSTILNIGKIRNGEFSDLIPELYELKDVIENNDWHNNDPVFNHTLDVLEKLEGLLKNIRDEISNYLGQKITNYTRKDLLFLAALFHDIAKKETLVKNNDITSCLKHEEVGATKIKEILSRFDLSEAEKDLVIQIVKYHGVVHLIIEPNNEKLDEDFAEFKINYSNIFLELILLAMADTLGSQLSENKPEEFNFRINFFEKVLSKY